jgi:6-phosphogluconolactonase
MMGQGDARWHARLTRVALPGEVSVVDDVPAAFAARFGALAPRSVALSGGATARRCYEVLAARHPDLSGVEVFFGDERFVPPDHPDSNEGLARRALLDHVATGAVHPMYRPGPIDAAAEAYDRLVRAAPPIDVVHLGVGEDGHTASLFPGAPALEERVRFVVATGDAAHPHPRLTFTYPAIARARVALVTVAGRSKRDVLARIARGADLPAARIRAGRVLWLVGRDAAPNG